MVLIHKRKKEIFTLGRMIRRKNRKIKKMRRQVKNTGNHISLHKIKIDLHIIKSSIKKRKLEKKLSKVEKQREESCKKFAQLKSKLKNLYNNADLVTIGNLSATPLPMGRGKAPSCFCSSNTASSLKNEKNEMSESSCRDNLVIEDLEDEVGEN